MTTDEVPDIYNASETDKKDISASNPEHFTNRDLDTEEKHSHGESHQLPELQRRLKSRHLQMIAMGKNRKLYAFFLFVLISIFISFYRRCHRHRSIHR